MTSTSSGTTMLRSDRTSTLIRATAHPAREPQAVELISQFDEWRDGFTLQIPLQTVKTTDLASRTMS